MLNISQLEAYTELICQDKVQCTLHFIVAPVGYFLLATFICVGNLLTIVAVLKTECLRTLQNMHIVSLAVADLLIGLGLYIIMVMHLRSVNAFVLLDRRICLFSTVFYWTSAAASNASIILIAVDRYLYIVHPLKYVQWITASRTRVVILLSWTYSFAGGFGIFYYNNLDKNGFCFIFGTVESTYQLGTNTVPFLVVCVVAFALYFKIIMTARKQQQRIFCGPEGSSVESRWKYKLKNIRLLVTVCGLYIACWLPYHLSFLNYIVTNYVSSSTTFLFLLGMMNSGVIFVVYPCMNSDFRKAFISIFCMCKSKRG